MKLPKGYPKLKASGVTPLGRSVLQDTWVSVTSGSEDYSFKVTPPLPGITSFPVSTWTGGGSGGVETNFHGNMGHAHQLGICGSSLVIVAFGGEW